MAMFGNVTWTHTDAAVSGTTPKGYHVVTFINTGATTVTFNGVTWAPGQGYCYAQVLNNTVAPMAYDPNGGSIRITLGKIS